MPPGLECDCDTVNFCYCCNFPKRYEKPETFYSFVWSHGREKLQGKPDYAKGSYYANPQYDKPVDDEVLPLSFLTW